MNTAIREVKENDNAELAKIIRNTFHEFNLTTANTVYDDPTTDHFYELFQIPNAILWVAQNDQELLGCCGIYPTIGLPAQCAELVKFYLAPQARGKGIGRLLFEKCYESAKQFGYTQLYLESFPQLATAVQMYTKYGFRKLPNPLGNSGHTSCNVWMIKEIV